MFCVVLNFVSEYGFFEICFVEFQNCNTRNESESSESAKLKVFHFLIIVFNAEYFFTLDVQK